MSASCFFRQAVAVDTNNHTLWMEYAEITYILQAYCSRYVRRDARASRRHASFPFQKDKALDYVPDRSFLLNICKEAYEKANQCTDNDENKEDWTYLYMMAKIDEKLHRDQVLDSLKKYVAVIPRTYGLPDVLHRLPRPWICCTRIRRCIHVSSDIIRRRRIRKERYSDAMRSR